MGTKIYNSTLTKELREGAQILTSIDTTPSEIAEKVVPTMEVNPKMLRRSKCLYGAEVTTTTSGSPGTAIYTASTTKDTYITAVCYSIGANAACDNITARIRVESNGQAGYVLSFFKPTLTAAYQVLNVTFPSPLKIDRGSAIRHYNAFTAGACTTDISIWGFEEETI